MKKLIALSLVLLAICNLQAQEHRVVTLFDFLHVYPYDIGTFPARPTTVITAINRNEAYGFNNWRLPTREEMAVIVAHQHIVPGLSATDYITSDGLSSGNVRLVTTGRPIAERRGLAEERVRRLEAMGAVVINGVGWARFNVASYGTFVSSETQYGGFFTSSRSRNACPHGWRLPTRTEFDNLLSQPNTWTTRNGVNGRIFGTAPNQIFLPATGRSCNHSGRRFDNGRIGFYWSNWREGVFRLSVTPSPSELRIEGWEWAVSSIRCVAE